VLLEIALNDSRTRIGDVFRLARMVGWPQITEPLLRERQAMSNEQFLEFLAGLLEAVGTRELDDEHYERAIGYPWERRVMPVQAIRSANVRRELPTLG
jgi:hypothetical protein